MIEKVLAPCYIYQETARITQHAVKFHAHGTGDLSCIQKMLLICYDVEYFLFISIDNVLYFG